MNVEIWHVEGTRFHFGRHGLGQEKSSVHFPSDSLFAALVTRIAIMYGRKSVEEFTARFIENSPPFLLTSAFPRWKDILFFPPPLSAGEKDISDETTTKTLKKVAYLSQGVFQSVIAGRSLAKSWDSSTKFHGETVLVTKEETEGLPEKITRDIRPEPMWQSDRQPRVTIDRVANSSTIYHTGQVLFNDDGGLWFGIRWLVDEPALKEKVLNVFTELGHAGLGGERSSGYGISKITLKNEISLPQPAGKPWVSLSRFIPKEEEISALSYPEAAYQIEAVGGWARSEPGKKDGQRRIVHLLDEGAVLGSLDTNAPGMMVDAQPSYDGEKPLGHPVYRNGFALGVGLAKGD